MPPANADCLALTACGEDRVGLVEELANRITAAGGNIEQSRMGVLGGQFALIMLLTGSKDALARLQTELDAIGDQLGLAIVQRWTTLRANATPTRPYAVEVVALDHPGIVHGLAQFFSRRGINIESLETDGYPAPHTGTPMFAVRMTVGIPAQHSIAALREEFLAHCDDLNLDARLEPVRP